MRLTLTTNEGELLDRVDVSAAEWRHAQVDSAAALALLGTLHAGEVADEDEDARQRINMIEVITYLHHLDEEALLETTGGNTGVIYVGRLGERRDADGDRYLLAAGPGDYTDGEAHIDEFGCGPDDDGTGEWIGFETNHPALIAQRIAAYAAQLRTAVGDTVRVRHFDGEGWDETTGIVAEISPSPDDDAPFTGQIVTLEGEPATPYRMGDIVQVMKDGPDGERARTRERLRRRLFSADSPCVLSIETHPMLIFPCGCQATPTPTDQDPPDALIVLCLGHRGELFEVPV